MHLLVFIVAYPLLWLISILPFRMFYLFSDVVFFFVYFLIGYRKKVVRTNLELAFPDAYLKTLRAIEKKFYRHLCDVFLEMIKSMHISEAAIKRRFVVKNPDVIQKYEAEHRSIILMCGHYASWEWMMSLAYHIKHKGFAIYMPIMNRYFDALVKKIRMRHKGFLISRYKAKQTLIKHKEEGLLAIYGFASDQSPRPGKAYYWRPFMGVNVPVFTGAEMLAKRLDYVVVFCEIEKVRRGYYEAVFKVLAEDPKAFSDYQITDKFTVLLEQQIKNKPEHYLWTHRRWKHRDKMPEHYKKVLH
ncbi:MAG: lysophospholipid acyltransferase family protein [Bacteroidota bacterium]